MKPTGDETNNNQTAEAKQSDTVKAGNGSNITGKSNSGIDHHPPSRGSGSSNRLTRWIQNPRITGAVAAVLLFAMLAAAIIPTSLNVRAEESETASLDPTMQLAKEYIYAGSRMLAIEDYGLSPGSTPTPTPTETPTPTPTETPTPTPTPMLKPDLVISNFTITPASPTEGDQVNFSVTVTNQGAGAMSGFLGVKYQIDGGCPAGGCPSHAVSSTTINPGQSVTLNGASGTWTAVVGAHTLSAQVDDVSTIDESDETNNVTILNVNVSPAPTPTPTPTPAPAIPSIASVTPNADPTCLDITLNGVSGADSYNVRILNSGYTINVTSLSFPWCGLAPATYYEYQAQAVNQYGTSGWSGIVGGTTASLPPTPSGLRFDGSEQTKIYLQWFPDFSGQITKYMLRVDGITIIDNIQGNSYVVTNLNPGTKYTFEIAGVTAAEVQSEWSAPVNGYTVSSQSCESQMQCPFGTYWNQTYCLCVDEGDPLSNQGGQK